MTNLTLEVIGGKAARMGGAARKTFTSGGTIGRLADNDWIFPDEYISGHHAKILFSNGAFFIEDTSTNGVFINSQENRLPRGKPHVLRSGDRIFIDDYEVRVTLEEQPTAPEIYAPSPGTPFSGALDPEESIFEDEEGLAGAPNATDPLRLLGLQGFSTPAAHPRAADLHNASPLAQHYRPPTPRQPAPRAPAADPGPLPSSAGAIPDNYNLMDSQDDPFEGPPLTPAPLSFAPPPARTVPPPQRIAPVGAAPTVVSPPPRVPKPGNRVPASDARPPPPAPKAPPPRAPVQSNEDPFESRAPTPAPKPTYAAGSPPRATPAVPPSAAPKLPAGRTAPPPEAERRAPIGVGGDLDFAAMLEAAGIDAARMTPELSRQFGMILRVVVEGLMEVLRARDKIKDEFRMRMTTFNKKDNNPLKFSANVEDALHNLLVKRNAAFLGPVEAFEDAFLDVRNHQMAMLAGVRVAYESMLNSFDPDELQREFETQVKGINFLGGGSRAKYWELYSNRFRAMVKDADSSFRHLFGDDFAKAYEEQLSRLKAADRAGASGGRRKRE
jgi:type VI secretion system FHA domain protein